MPTKKEKTKPLQKSSPLVVGLDLSLTASGYVALDGETMVASGVIKSKPSGEMLVDEARRLSNIVDEIVEGVEGLPNATLVVIEGIAFMIQKTTSLVQLAAINYMIRIALWKKGIPFVIVSPPSLKKFVTGKGKAQKDEMMLDTYKRWGVSLTENNICDAYGLARIGLALLGKDDKIDATQREVVTLCQKQVPHLGTLDKHFLD